MKLPNKAYEVEFIDDFQAISYFPKKNSTEESIREVSLPTWLAKEIRQAVANAHYEGKKSVIKQVRGIFDVES